MCRKVPYETRAEARAQGRYYSSRGRKQQHPYWCPKCGYWHLTSMSRKRAKQVEKRRRDEQW